MKNVVGYFQFDYDDVDTAKKVLNAAGWVEKQIL